jgi:hypothetical protein
MHNALEIMVLVIVIVLIAWSHYYERRLIRKEHTGKHEEKIQKYLAEHSLQLVEIRSPNDEDWEDKCFNKPLPFEFSFATVRIAGMVVNWSDREYSVIDTLDEQGRSVRVWLEAFTAYFQKPLLTFKKYRPSDFFNPPKPNPNDGTASIKDNCPACGWKLTGEENMCPECELQFQ